MTLLEQAADNLVFRLEAKRKGAAGSQGNPYLQRLDITSKARQAQADRMRQTLVVVVRQSIRTGCVAISTAMTLREEMCRPLTSYDCEMCHGDRSFFCPTLQVLCSNDRRLRWPLPGPRLGNGLPACPLRPPLELSQVFTIRGG